MSPGTWDILWVFKVICSSDWRTRYTYVFSLAVEKTDFSSSYCIFQEIQKRFSAYRNFLFENAAVRRRVSAELRQHPCSSSCCQHSTLLGSCCSQGDGCDTSTHLFNLLSGKGSVLEDQGDALSLLIPGQEGFILSEFILELRNTNETATLFTRGVFPKAWPRLKCWLQQGSLGWVTIQPSLLGLVNEVTRAWSLWWFSRNTFGFFS